VLTAGKIKICKTLIRLVATYRAEASMLNKGITKQVAVIKRKVLRRIFGKITVSEN
jgi:hypothetical protein